MRTPTNESLTPDIADSGKARSNSGSDAPYSQQKSSEPERRCILSGNVEPRSKLIRLAISPDGDVLPDPLAKAPGRGAWIGVDRAELEEAIAKGKLRGALARAFKGAPLSVPDDLPERITQALDQALRNRLGLEMRIGALVLGSDRIAEQARSGAIAMLLHASDASESGRSKLDQAWRVGCDAEGTGLRGIVLPLDRAALSVALGRDNVVHLGVTSRKGLGEAAMRIRAILTRFQDFLGEQPGGRNGAPLDASAAAGLGEGENREMDIEG